MMPVRDNYFYAMLDRYYRTFEKTFFRYRHVYKHVFLAYTSNNNKKNNVGRLIAHSRGWRGSWY